MAAGARWQVRGITCVVVGMSEWQVACRQVAGSLYCLDVLLQVAADECADRAKEHLRTMHAKHMSPRPGS